DATAQELVEHVADEIILAEGRARVVEALLLELPLDVLELAPARAEGLEAGLLLANFLFLVENAGPRIVDLGEDGVVAGGGGAAGLGKQGLKVLPAQCLGECCQRLLE